MKSKFKVMDILRLVEKQHNMTTGGLYCANQVYDGGADIPVIETVDDYGLVVSLYETSFEATDVVLATNKTIMSEEEAVFTVEAKIDECYKEENVVGGKGDLFVNYFVGSEFITKIQHDKELQKALLVLIGESK
jgi:hypothetical protein